MDTYGIELIIDIHECDVSTFTRKNIKDYFISLCKVIDMDREDLHFWDYEGDPEGYEKAPSHLRGISAVQFIKTSNITIHTLNDLRKIFINLFSCKEFDYNTVIEFSEKWFKGKTFYHTFIERY